MKRKKVYSNEKKYSIFIKHFSKLYFNINTSETIKKQLTNNNENFKYTSFLRNNMLFYTTTLAINTVDTVYTVYRIYDTKLDKSCIYSIVLYNLDDTHKIHGNLSYMNYTPQYINIGGSCVSKDGEYRSILNNLFFINKISQLHINNIILDIEKYLISKQHQRKQILSFDTYYPNDNIAEQHAELEYLNNTNRIIYFTYAWFITYYKHYMNIMEDNLNESFKIIFLKHEKEDIAFFKLLIEKYTMKEIDLLRFYFNNNFLSSSDFYESYYDNIKLGQKLIPLSLSDVQNPFNLMYKPWREYLININITNLVTNNITPGFPICNNYSYIKNTKKTLYDNEIQYEKLHSSGIAISIYELLNKARSYTYMNLDKDKIIKEKINSWISNKFKTLHDKINDPIDFIKNDMIMSEVTLAMVSEYTGRTIWDVFILISKSPYYNKLVGEPLTSRGSKYFTKYIFDVCYSLLAMNEKYGIIHGDLHLNNITLHNNTYKSFSENGIKNPQILYIIDDNNQYIFDTCGYYSCIIDYSRSIILPDKLSLLKDLSLPKSHEYLIDHDKFHLEQVKRLIHIYKCYSDDKTDSETLTFIFKNKFEAVFKLLTATDVYSMVDKILKLFLSDELKKPHDKSLLMLKNIKEISNQFITIEMSKLINIKEYEQIVLKMEWPIKTIIEKCFYENNINNYELKTIVDVFNINNNIKYSIQNSLSFPSYWSDININYKNILLKSIKVNESIKNKNLKVINLIASRHYLKYQ